MRYELKKFISKSNIMVILIITLVISFISPLLSVANYYSLSKKGNEIIEIKGLEGIKNEKKKYETVTGNLDTAKLNETLRTYKQADRNNNYISTDLKYPNILPLLIAAFSPVQEYNIEYLDNQLDANKFYEERINKITEFLELDYREKMFEDWEMGEIKKKAEAINTPFNYNFYEQWNLLFQNLNFMLMMVIFSSIIVSSQLYSYENEKNMGIILNSSGEKSLIKIGENKIKAASVFMLIQYTLCFVIISIIFFIAFGIEGYNSEIQISRRYFLSIYSLTFGKAYILYFILGLLSILAITGIVSTIDAYIQKSYMSLILGSIIIIIPFILCTLNTLPLFIRKFLSIQPINGIFVDKILISQQIYKIAAFKMLGAFSILIMCILIYLIAINLAPKLFIISLKEK